MLVKKNTGIPPPYGSFIGSTASSISFFDFLFLVAFVLVLWNFPSLLSHSLNGLFQCSFLSFLEGIAGSVRLDILMMFLVEELDDHMFFLYLSKRELPAR